MAMLMLNNQIVYVYTVVGFMFLIFKHSNGMMIFNENLHFLWPKKAGLHIEAVLVAVGIIKPFS
jgi:hypothetical protein